MHFLGNNLAIVFRLLVCWFCIRYLPQIPTGFLNSCSSSKHSVQATYFSHNIFHMFGSIFDNWKYAKSVVLQDIHTIVQPAYTQQYIKDTALFGYECVHHPMRGRLSRAVYTMRGNVLKIWERVKVPKGDDKGELTFHWKRQLSSTQLAAKCQEAFSRQCEFTAHTGEQLLSSCCFSLHSVESALVS